MIFTMYNPILDGSNMPTCLKMGIYDGEKKNEWPCLFVNTWYYQFNTGSCEEYA